MRKALDFLVSVLATICIFAFPVALIGGVPFLGDTLVRNMHWTFGGSFSSMFRGVMLMLGSSAAVMLLAVPAFGGLSWLVFKLSRYVASQEDGPIQRSADPGQRKGTSGPTGTFLRPVRPTAARDSASAREAGHAPVRAAAASAASSADRLRAAKRDALIRQTGREPTP